MKTFTIIDQIVINTPDNVSDSIVIHTRIRDVPYEKLQPNWAIFWSEDK